MGKFIVNNEEMMTVRIGISQLTDTTVTVFAKSGDKVDYILNMNENGVEFIDMPDKLFTANSTTGYGIPKIWEFGTLPGK